MAFDLSNFIGVKSIKAVIRAVFQQPQKQIGVQQTGRQDDKDKDNSQQKKRLGFTTPPPPSINTYRQMGYDPTLALGKNKLMAPIQQREWIISPKDESVGDGMAKIVASVFNPLRANLVRNCGFAIDYGRQHFETVYERVGRFIAPADFAPLLIDKTEYAADPQTGKIVGLTNKDRMGNEVVIANFNAFTFRHNGEARSLSGRSVFENSRPAWSYANQAMEKFGQYLTRICNFIPIVHGPIGTVRDAAGAERPSSWVAYDAIGKVYDGAGVFLPNEFASVLEAGRNKGVLTSAAWETALKFAGSSQWKFDFADAGGSNHCAGFIASQEYLDYLKVRGLMIPEQALLHTQHGTRGQSQQHDNTADIVSEMLYWEICEQVQAKIDDFLEINFGPDKRGAVIVTPPRISDENSQGLQKIAEALAANSQTAVTFAQNIDIPDFLDSLGIPLAQFPTPFMQPQPQMPPQNGNGNGRLAHLDTAASHIGEQ